MEGIAILLVVDELIGDLTGLAGEHVQPVADSLKPLQESNVSQIKRIQPVQKAGLTFIENRQSTIKLSFIHPSIMT